MIIYDVGIPDIVKENLDSSKIDLANKIINGVYPLLDEVFVDKEGKIDSLKARLKMKTDQIKINKKNLESMMVQLKKEKIKEKLLGRVSKLVASGLAYQGTIRNETIVLLKIIDSLSEEKLNQHLQQTMTTISKRFARE